MSKLNKKTKIYSTLVFDDSKMKKSLSKQDYEAYKKLVNKGQKLSLKLADSIAEAMKDWAVKNGATHFTHWFQPLNGTTSEKHDAFLVPSESPGKAIFSFSGKALISGEGDASSFPSGGLRATFEARGYTAWDPSSNAFIKDEVLCIPTAFCSYNGQALDKKTPLLRSMDAIKNEIKTFMKFFDIDAKNIVVNVGAEQELFLIPKDDYKAREDLVMCGRTLFGNKPAKGQELEEHYYGCLRPTVSNYMKELDDELWELGIAAHTKHNEAAPSQHELAPIYTNANRAIDENLITMEKMQLLASKYNLACLLHERPFEGINGSGKHCNWSVCVDDINLLDPGKSDSDILRFLAFLACVIAGVDDYQELLRSTVATAGNDCRLGGNEAPPAIVSIYLGQALQNIIDAVVSGNSFENLKNSKVDLGVSFLPQIMRDSSDRNRTSPFAFTTNKFEFRMPGSQMNLSSCVTVLNTAIAKSIQDFSISLSDLLDKSVKKIESGKVNLDDVILQCIANTLKKHKRIIFNGDGYSTAWTKEAKKRGLANNITTADALPCLVSKKSIELFEHFSVLTKQELESRYIIGLEIYNKLINIEARVMHRMTKRTYLPAINNYASCVADQINKFKKANSKHDLKHQKLMLNTLLSGIDNINECLNMVTKLSDSGKKIDDEQKRANHNAYKLVPAMKNLRRAVDDMEHIVSRDYWPVPSYNNMLFYV